MLRKRSLNGEGQTSVDFLIGFSIFAVTLLFVLQIITGPVVQTEPESQTKSALAERSGEILLANWSEDVDPGVIENESAEDYLTRSYEDVGDDLNIPKENGNFLYSYNITVGKLENISSEPPHPIEPDLSAGNSTANKTFDRIAGERRVAYMNRTGGKDEMVSVRVKIW